MKKVQGGIVPANTVTDNRRVIHEGHYHISKEAIEKYGIKFLNAINKGAPMQTVPNKVDASDSLRVDSCEECSDFEVHEGGSLRCGHPDAVGKDIIDPNTYKESIPIDCPLEEYTCGCRHPECSEGFTPDTRTKHGLKDHEMAALVNAVRDALQPYIKIQWARGVISQAVAKYLEANDLRIDKRDW